MQLSRRTKRHILEAVLLAILSVAVILPWGCGKSPFAPQNSGVILKLPNGVVAQPGQLLNGSGTAPANAFSASAAALGAQAASVQTYGPYSQDIDSTGGSISLDLGDNAEGTGDVISYFVVPAGALHNDSTGNKTHIIVTATRGINEFGEEFFVYDFEPSGLQFAKPAYLAHKSSLPPGSMQVLYWFDSEQSEWVSAAVAVSADGYATFPVSHFSLFGLTEAVVSLGGQ